MSAAISDRRLLRRASLAVALQTGAAVAIVVSAVIALVYVVGLEARRDASENKLHAKVAEAGSHHVTLDGTDTVVLDGMPTSCPERHVRETAARLPDGQSRVDICDNPFLAYVGEAADGTRVTAIMNFVEQQEETERLARFSLAAGALGVLASAALGWAFGRRAVRSLGEALASQRHFVADVSHELRTPLAIVLTRAQLLLRGAAVDPAQRLELEQLAQDAKIAAEVVDDLLLTAEIQHRPLPRVPVDLNALAQEVRASFAARAELAGLDLVVDARPDTSYVVKGTTSALRRAVSSLVDNAFAHVRPGGRVVIALRSRGTEVGLAVIDDGEGLDPALARELIKRFRRGSKKEAGRIRLGLGLALVNEIVGAHGGTLTIDGAPGSGATFALLFPTPGTQERHRAATGPATERDR
ncbi:HAMP domain-containing sensor histidine kinase [Promicromonospora sp. NPDC023987]|uniref:sensor histidine kinase n=1 Tax=Promicromonospora sp. NPDC023987 TaxID=3155360 RepID=UPI0034098AE6